jgi:hypothetical protein
MPHTRSQTSKQTHQRDRRLIEKQKVIAKRDQPPYSTISKQTRRSSPRLEQRQRAPLSDKTNELHITPITDNSNKKRNVRANSRSTPMAKKKQESTVQNKHTQNEETTVSPLNTPSEKELPSFVVSPERDTSILNSSILNNIQIPDNGVVSSDSSELDDPFGFTAAELRAQQKKEDNILPSDINQIHQSVNTEPSLQSPSATTTAPTTSTTTASRRKMDKAQTNNEIISSQELSLPPSEHSDDILPESIKSKSVVGVNSIRWDEDIITALPKRRLKVKQTKKQTRNNKRTTGRNTRSASKNESLTESTPTTPSSSQVSLSLLTD